VEEVREPAVDLFVEKDHVLIVAEMPGISATDVKLAVKDDVLTITAEKGDKKYRKEVLLPGVYAKSKMRWVCNNGVVKITCGK
jgi:HSP20 family protein